MEQEIRFCTTPDGVRIAIAISGNGPPLVKAANWLSHLEFDWQSPVWRHWLQGLTKHHTLIRYDERGCGLSDWDVNDFSLAAWVSDLETVVDTVGLDSFPLLGISQGGAVAIEYALRHPERVSHLILYGAFARGALRRHDSSTDPEERRTLLSLIKLGWGRENPAFRQVFTTLFIPEGTPEQQSWFNKLQRVSTSPENAVRFAGGFAQIDVTENAKKITAPTLVLHSKGEANIPFEEGRLLAAMISGARLIPLDSNNHILLETEPAWTRFLAEFYSFLGITDAAAARPARAQLPLSAPYSELTMRELDVLELLARGYRNAEIAKELVLSPKTVRNYVSRILGKLGLHSRGEAIVIAKKWGFGLEEE